MIMAGSRKDLICLLGGIPKKPSGISKLWPDFTKVKVGRYRNGITYAGKENLMMVGSGAIFPLVSIDRPEMNSTD